MTTHHASRPIFWLLVLTLLIAAVLRLWQIGTLPPGLHYDEAADTIIAQQIARGESAPIFVAAYTGKEVLFFYWAALGMRLIGPTVFAMRLAAAMMGIFTVAATYWAVRELFAPRRSPLSMAGRGVGGESVALLAAVFIATSFWHVLMSRLGFRSIGEPLVQALALAALFRGLRLNRWPWIILAGALVGLNLYTYLAARLFPLAIAVIFFYLIIFDRGQRRRRLTQFVVMASIALLVFAPLGAYFLNHPAAFLTRIQQVAPRPDQAAALIENVLRALGMFFLSGDPYIRFNLPGRPLFTFVWGLLFIAGLIGAFAGVFRGRTVWRRTAYFSVIAVTTIMFLPTALAVNEITPSNLRAIGMMPLIFAFPALGTWWVIRWMWDEGRRLRRWLARPKILLTIMVAVLVAAGIETGAIYFGQYVHEPQLYIQSDGDLADIARVLDHIDTQGEPVYVAALHYRHPTVAALSDKYGDLKWIAGNRAVILPNGPAYLFFSRLGLPDETWLRRLLPDSALIDQPLAPDGETNYRAYHLTAQPVITPQVKLNVNFGNIIQLIGYDNVVATDRNNVAMTLYWRVLNHPDRGDYSTFVQLRDPWGFEWGQAGSFDYPSEQWTPGEIIVNRIDVPIAGGAPPGDYELRVGWFSPEANQRLSVVAPDGQFGGTVARLKPISIVRADTWSEAGALGIGTRLGREAGDGLRLLGYSRAGSTVPQGAPLYFTLYWQSTQPLQDAPINIRLRRTGAADAAGSVMLTTTQPVHGSYPFSQWAPAEVVADRYAVQVPFDTPPGSYTLQVDVGERLSADLGDVQVAQVNRVLDEPPLDHHLSMKLDDAIELIGYNLDQTSAAIKLTLFWHALHAVDEDYTVFTHALDRAGQQIGGQDNQPVNGQYPTSHWMPGEYVTDEYVIPVNPADAAVIEVGMYNPETGARLGETIRLKP